VRRSYPKAIRFEEKNRSGLTFSDPTKIRLNPETNRLELKTDTYGDYPTDADLHVKSWVTNPETLKGWLGFHADPLEQNQPDGTSIRFRLGDGTDEYYHDGGSWVVAGASNWNTEVEVAANISTFPVAEQKLQVIVNLATTDKTVTPTCEGVCLMMDVDLDYLPSIVGDSLAASLREGMRTVIDHALVFDQGGTKISLLDLETAFNVVTVRAAYDYDADPKKLTDIFSAYDPSSKNVTLTTALAAGTKVWLKLEVEPEVYINWGSQDYIEVEKLPAIVVDRIEGNGAQVFGIAHVRDASTKTARVLKRPYRIALLLDIVLMAAKDRPLFTMMDQALVHAHENAVLRWRAVDEQISLKTVTEIDFRPRPDLRDEHGSSYSLRLEEINLWLGPEEARYLVERMNLTLTASPS
jgi:hypothetical protein